MLSMFSTSLRGLQAGRYLAEPPPAPPSPPPEQLDFDSLLVLSASQSGSLSEREVVAEASLEVTSVRMVEEELQEEVEEASGRLWRMLLIVSLNSRRRLVEDGKVGKGEVAGSLGRWRGACCSFNVSPEEEEKGGEPVVLRSCLNSMHHCGGQKFKMNECGMQEGVGRERRRRRRSSEGEEKDS